MSYTFKESRKIKDVYDFNDEASEMVECLMNRLIEEGEQYTRQLTEDEQEGNDQGFDWLFTSEAMGLMDRMITRLDKIGCKYYDFKDVDIQRPYIEFE